jgi:hypothetical protein
MGLAKLDSGEDAQVGEVPTAALNTLVVPLDIH